MTWLQQAVALDQVTSGGTASPLPTELKDLVAQTAAILRTMVAEATDGLAAKGAMPRRPDIAKVGARNSAADLERIQALHDTAVDLGASCGVQKSAPPQSDGRLDVLAAGIADILARVRNIEAQPQPLPLVAAARAVTKRDDVGPADTTEATAHLLDNPHALSLLAIKMAQRNGQRFGRG